MNALALVDSVHSQSNIKGRPVIDLFNNHVRHWVASKEKLDTDMPYHTKDAGCPCVSSGHSPHLPFYYNLPGLLKESNALYHLGHAEHENAPGAAKDSIMQYLENEISQ